MLANNNSWYRYSGIYSVTLQEPPHDKTKQLAVRPAKTQISLGIRPVWLVFTVPTKKAWVLNYPLSAQQRFWSDWTDAQADLSLRWAHSHFVGFVMRRLTIFLRQCDENIRTLYVHKEPETRLLISECSLICVGVIGVKTFILSITVRYWNLRRFLTTT